MKSYFYESYVLRMKVWTMYEGLILIIVVRMYEVWFQYLYVRTYIWNYDFKITCAYVFIEFSYYDTYACTHVPIMLAFYFLSIRTYKGIYDFNICYIFLNISVVCFLCFREWINECTNFKLIVGLTDVYFLSWQRIVFT